MNWIRVLSVIIYSQPFQISPLPTGPGEGTHIGALGFRSTSNVQLSARESTASALPSYGTKGVSGLTDESVDLGLRLGGHSSQETRQTQSKKRKLEWDSYLRNPPQRTSHVVFRPVAVHPPNINPPQPLAKPDPRQVGDRTTLSFRTTVGFPGQGIENGKSQIPSGSRDRYFPDLNELPIQGLPTQFHRGFRPFKKKSAMTADSGIGVKNEGLEGLSSTRAVDAPFAEGDKGAQFRAIYTGPQQGSPKRTFYPVSAHKPLPSVRVSPSQVGGGDASSISTEIGNHHLPKNLVVGQSVEHGKGQVASPNVSGHPTLPDESPSRAKKSPSVYEDHQTGMVSRGETEPCERQKFKSSIPQAGTGLAQRNARISSPYMTTLPCSSHPPHPFAARQKLTIVRPNSHQVGKKDSVSMYSGMHKPYHSKSQVAVQGYPTSIYQINSHSHIRPPLYTGHPGQLETDSFQAKQDHQTVQIQETELEGKKGRNILIHCPKVKGCDEASTSDQLSLPLAPIRNDQESKD